MNQRGFTLIEALVAVVIGVLMIFGIGGLGQRLIHNRTSTDASSAAMSLAERQLERLLATTKPNPTATECATVNSFDLCAGTHTAVTMSENGVVSGSGKYTVQWVVVDASGSASSPLVIPTPSSAAVNQTFVKQITVTVTHANDPLVRAQVVTYYRIENV